MKKASQIAMLFLFIQLQTILATPVANKHHHTKKERPLGALLRYATNVLVIFCKYHCNIQI